MSNMSAKRLSGDGKDEEIQEMRAFYVDMLSYIERLHRLLLDVIKAELDQAGLAEVNPVQALLLYNIGNSELTAGELRTRGYYQGSNVSYNLKKLVDTGYVSYERSHIDRRSVRVKLTEKGTQVLQLVSKMYDRHAQSVADKRIIDVAGLEDLCFICKDFERFWSDNIRYGD